MEISNMNSNFIKGGKGSLDFADLTEQPMQQQIMFNPANNFRERDAMYKLIISQLFYDGQPAMAKSIANMAQITDMCPPSDKLYNIVAKALKDGDSMSRKEVLYPNGAIDLDFETEKTGNVAQPSAYETVYVTAHKGPCRAGVFSADGQLVATGSGDASIKILDVERMLAKAHPSDHQDMSQGGDMHPVIRTLYDHLEEVSCLAFHPKEQYLISGSHDMTIKMFDYSKPSVKRAFKSVQESAIVRCLDVHPSGEYLIVGTQHPTLRLYHIPTFQAFISPVLSDQHKAPITSVSYSQNSSLYVSTSKDGSIRIWDTISNRCVAHFPEAHEGFDICSAVFSRNGKYIISTGKDSLVKLWEVCMSRCLIAYTGAGNKNKQQHRKQATFNHTEDYVMVADESSTSLCCWDSRNAERQKMLALGHNHPVRLFAHSPTAPAFLTCSDDFRARFWYNR